MIGRSEPFGNRGYVLCQKSLMYESVDSSSVFLNTESSSSRLISRRVAPSLPTNKANAFCSIGWVLTPKSSPRIRLKMTKRSSPARIGSSPCSSESGLNVNVLLGSPGAKYMTSLCRSSGTNESNRERKKSPSGLMTITPLPASISCTIKCSSKVLLPEPVLPKTAR